MNLLFGDFDNVGIVPLFDGSRKQTAELVGNFHE
jgi:hypothetical protein